MAHGMSEMTCACVLLAPLYMPIPQSALTAPFLSAPPALLVMMYGTRGASSAARVVQCIRKWSEHMTPSQDAMAVHHKLTHLFVQLLLAVLRRDA